MLACCAARITLHGPTRRSMTMLSASSRLFLPFRADQGYGDTAVDARAPHGICICICICTLGAKYVFTCIHSAAKSRMIRRVEREAEMDRLHGGREARLKTEARWRAEEEARQPFLRECELMARSLPLGKYLEWWREQKALGRE